MAEGYEAKEAECKQYEEIVYDIIKDIRDPEREETLEQLDVVYESGVNVRHIGNDTYIIKVEFTPTVPHCTLATMIGLCIRLKLKNDLPFKHKLDILIKEGTHNTGAQIIKQINDKERVLAALENPNLRDLVEQCIEAQDY